MARRRWSCGYSPSWLGWVVPPDAPADAGLPRCVLVVGAVLLSALGRGRAAVTARARAPRRRADVLAGALLGAPLDAGRVAATRAEARCGSCCAAAPALDAGQRRRSRPPLRGAARPRTSASPAFASCSWRCTTSTPGATWSFAADGGDPDARRCFRAPGGRRRSRRAESDRPHRPQREHRSSTCWRRADACPW